ncbi:PEP-CTERM sorting domain-containing protein [Acidihalobacter yilgarnensis]|nr:PEP-CTERM sorting domain-containing protein [Acidihalobacter yilgarnensis]
MKSLQKSRLILSGLIMAGAMGMAQTASATAIDGINLPAGNGFTSTNGWETLVSGTGQTVTGWGIVNSFNNSASSYCAGGTACQLTYYFTGDVTKFDPTATNGNKIILDNVNAYFYANPTFTYNGSAQSMAAANVTDGSLWLQAAGHTSLVNGETGQIFGTAVGTTAQTYSGFGAGLLDATGGPAAPYFIPSYTDGLTNNLAAFLLTMTYNHSAGNTVVQNQVMTANYNAVPEPSDLGMMGLGLLMVGLMGLRFRQSRYRRD